VLENPFPVPEAEMIGGKFVNRNALKYGPLKITSNSIA